MTNTQTPLPPAGWFTDPHRAGQLRWWNGLDWTAEVRPIPAPYSLEPSAAEVPDRRAGKSGTFPIVLLALSPIWANLILSFAGSSGITVSAVVGALVVSVPFVALIFGLGYLDNKRLVARGFPATNPAWALLLPVYFVLRTRRVGLRGLGVAILYAVVAVLAAIITVFAVATGIANTVRSSAAGCGCSTSQQQDYDRTLVPIWNSRELPPPSPSERAQQLTPFGMAATLKAGYGGTSTTDGLSATAVSCEPLTNGRANCRLSILDGRQFRVVVTEQPANSLTSFRVDDISEISAGQ